MIRTRRALGLVPITALLTATLAVPAQAGSHAEAATVAIDWHRHATEAIYNPPTAAVPGAGQSPTVGSIHQAMVQLAVYDAVNAIDGRHEPYLDNLPDAPHDASQAAAAAVAAHDVLVDLVPSLPAAVDVRLDALLAATLATIPEGQAKTAGIAIGAATADAMLAERADDGRFGPFRFVTGMGIGEWRPTPPAFANDPGGWVARVRPFTLSSASQFRTAGPAPMRSRTYARDLNEVKALGSATSTLRTAPQTALAQFYIENPFTVFGRGLRALAETRGLNLAQAARLFAMTSVSGADALIACWDDKAHWNFWRPINAIAEAASDGNPRTTAQAGWSPLLANPPYPEHPSGYNCATGAVMQAAREFWGRDEVSITLTLANGTSRTYSRFSDIWADTIDARVWLGIHFRTADEQGAKLGLKVARWVDDRFFQRVDDAD